MFLISDDYELYYLVIVPIYWISSINGIAYMIYNFIDFRKPVDPEDPLNRHNLYKVSGTWMKVKKWTFILSMLTNNVFVPIAAIWAFTYILLQVPANLNPMAEYLISWLLFVLS